MSIDGAGSSAKWNCFRATCGFAGGTARKDPRGDSNGLVPLSARKKKQVHQPVVRPQVELRPLTEEMVAFFASRGISKETLERNKVRISISARRAIGVRLACDLRAIGVRLACAAAAAAAAVTTIIDTAMRKKHHASLTKEANNLTTKQRNKQPHDHT